MRALAACVVTAAACTAAAAQSTDVHGETYVPGEAYVEQVVVERVRWPVLVSPRRGAPPGACQALGPEDFVASEDGVPVRIASVDREGGPATFLFLLDTSGSMLDVLDVTKDAAAEFARSLSPQDEMAVFTFARDLLPVVTPTQDPAAVAAAIREIRGGGMYTALVDAVWEALDLFDGRRGRLVLLLFSERVATKRDLRIFAIAPRATLTDVRAYAPLLWLTETTAGRIEYVSRDTDVEDALDGIRERIGKEVLVGYAPPKPKAGRGAEAGSGPRKVRVKIRARDGLPCRVREAAPERTRM